MSCDVEVVSVNVSRDKGTPKQPVDRIEIDALGVRGDAHAGPGHRQVSLLSQETIERFGLQTGRRTLPGEFAENLTLRGYDLGQVAPLDRLCLNDVELEISQIGKECHGTRCAIFQQVGRCVMPAEGLFARVVHGGSVQAGDRGRFVPRTLRLRVITLSDRAAAGVYADRSGPRVCELLEAFLAGSRWHAAIDAAVIPDDAMQLDSLLVEALREGVDAVFTTGGTGVGPRDITPDVVAPRCDKLLPGIMDHIRVKFGAQHPAARLSRAVAGVAGRTQFYTLPGSVRAVEEYLGAILETFEHLLFMLHGLDVHHSGRRPLTG
jgi:molybdenum cofactor synthesis domain-containing protein